MSPGEGGIDGVLDANDKNSVEEIMDRARQTLNFFLAAQGEEVQHAAEYDAKQAKQGAQLDGFTGKRRQMRPV